jgi:hypothetical protein
VVPLQTPGEWVEHQEMVAEFKQQELLWVQEEEDSMETELVLARMDKDYLLSMEVMAVHCVVEQEVLEDLVAVVVEVPKAAVEVVDILVVVELIQELQMAAAAAVHIVL